MYNNSALIEFISYNHTPIRAKLLLNAIEGILAYNVLDIVPHLEGIVLNDDLDTTSKIEGIKTTVTNTIKEILLSVNIIPYQEVNDFIKISKIIIALETSANEYFPDYILDNTLLESEDETAISKLHSLVHLIQGQSELEYYDVIHSVDDSVIDELLAIFRSKVVPDIDADDPTILDRYRKFIDGRAKGAVYEYIRNGGTVGRTDADGMMTMLSEAILAKSAPDRPFDIISGVLISDTEDSEIDNALADWANYFSDNEHEHALIEREIKELRK